MKSHEFGQLLDTDLSAVDVLSLDCFDTLVWRSVATPVDVFFLLQQHPLYRQHDLTASVRQQAEARARKLAHRHHGRHEVSLTEIYATALPDACPQDIAALVQLEIDTEKEVCYLFEPALRLMQEARAKGLQTFIISDSYLSSAQLRELLEHLFKRHQLEMPIDQVHASSDYGFPKALGLVGLVAQAAAVQSGRILHLGDNRGADLEGAQRSGAQGHHFEQWGKQARDIMRSQQNVLSLLQPQMRQKSPLPMAYKELWSHLPDNLTPEDTIAHYSLGPAMLPFAEWVIAQARQLKSEGKTPRLVFMMRDAYLVQRIVQILIEVRREPLDVSSIDVSRFVAFGSTFQSRDQVLDYLDLVESSRNYRAALKQLLFPPHEIELLAKKFAAHPMGWRAFCEYLTSQPVAQKIYQRSQRMRQRLWAHMESQIRPRADEVLLFVDLGYAGTIQKLLARQVSQRWSVHVQGLYYLLKDSDRVGHDMAGFIVERQQDRRLIELMLSHIKVLEQLSCNDNPSVIDFSESGAARYAAHDIREEQRALKAQVQESTLAFCRQAASSEFTPSCTDPVVSLGAIGRLLFMPQHPEIKFLMRFDHDVNLGVRKVEAMADPELAREQMRLRGLQYFNKNDRSMPAYELALAGSAEYLWFYLSSNRLGLNMLARDFEVPDERLALLYMMGGQVRQLDLPVYANADGHKMVMVPVHPMAQGVGLPALKGHAYLQIKSCRLMENCDVLLSRDLVTHEMDLLQRWILEGVTRMAGDLMFFEKPQAMMYLNLESLPLGQWKQPALVLVYKTLAAEGVRVHPVALPSALEISAEQ